MTKKIPLAIIAANAAVVTAGLVSIGTGADADWPPAGYPVCVTEDDPGPCYWDAYKHGNGKGRSFYMKDSPQGTHPVYVGTESVGWRPVTPFTTISVTKKPKP